MKSLKDEQLVKLYSEGNLGAFEEIFDRYSKRIEYFFYRMLWNDKEKASDFTQDLFLKVIEKVSFFNPEYCFKTWIFSMANNMCKNEYRRAEVHNKAHELIKFEKPAHHLNGAEKSTDYEAFLNELNAVLALEEETKKAAFMLKYFEEMPIKEISEILNIPEGTIKSGLHYTTKRISKKLKHFKPI